MKAVLGFILLLVSGKLFSDNKKSNASNKSGNDYGIS